MKSDYTYWKDNCHFCGNEIVLRQEGYLNSYRLLTDGCDCEKAHDVTFGPANKRVPFGSVLVWREEELIEDEYSTGFCGRCEQDLVYRIGKDHNVLWPVGGCPDTIGGDHDPVVFSCVKTGVIVIWDEACE